MEKQKIIISDDLEKSLSEAIGEVTHDSLFVLCDETTERLCLPVVSNYECMNTARRISIKATDTHKTLESLSHVWSELQRMGATRHSLMVNLGGGMVTDLGGFAASTFKRGIPFINIPTTLLAMVDASVGGKTGINFGGLKNEIGVFNNARSVILDTIFLRTMDCENILSRLSGSPFHRRRDSSMSSCVSPFRGFAGSSTAELSTGTEAFSCCTVSGSGLWSAS